MQQTRKKNIPSASVKSKLQAAVPSPFYLKYALLILTVLTVLVYCRVFQLGFTELDDKFFIIQNEPFNKDLANIPVSFGRGLFGPDNDLYYRPLLLVDFIIEHAFFGTSPWGYHLTNLLFHTLTVCLLFLFFRKIKIRETDALIIAALFAVHPVLSQAVAWIPGRNDLLLMIFFLATLISTIQYSMIGEKSKVSWKWMWFLAQFVFLLLALFTKETGVVIPLITLTMLIFVFKKKWETLAPIIISSAVSILIWFISRSIATLLNEPTSFTKLVSTGFSRIPAMIQYTGKIFFPVNLSVYPMMEDTVMVWGIVAVALLAALVIFSKSCFKPLTIIGILWFMVFLAPVLIVPKSLSDQVFEHRLYIPFAGLLILLSQTILFAEKWNDRTKMIIAGPVILFLAAISFYRTGYYKDADTFWRKAITDSPHAIMPKMMRVNGALTPEEREQIRRQCYSFPQDQMMVHYTLGKIYMQMNRPDSAERHFRLELACSQFPDIYYQLALINAGKKNFDSTLFCLNKVIELDPGHANVPRIKGMIRGMKKQFYLDKAQAALQSNQPDSAAIYLQKVITVDPLNQEAHHNLVVLYLQTNQIAKAKEVIDQMKLKKLEIAPDFLELMNKP